MDKNRYPLLIAAKIKTVEAIVGDEMNAFEHAKILHAIRTAKEVVGRKKLQKWFT